jgi:hypothetical protein
VACAPLPTTTRAAVATTATSAAAATATVAGTDDSSAGDADGGLLTYSQVRQLHLFGIALQLCVV